MENVFTTVAVVFEALGAVTMVIGLVIALVLGARALARGQAGEPAFQLVRRTLGGGIMLGLEILVAADLVRTITSKPSVEEYADPGHHRADPDGAVAVDLDEVEGVLPWRRALLTSGATVLATEIRRDRAARHAAAPASPPTA